MQQLPFELPEFENDIEEMIIEEEFGNDCYGTLLIENYPNLQSFIVKKNSLQNLNSLKICDCEKLNTFEIEDDEEFLVDILLALLDGEAIKYLGAFYNVKNVIIASISIKCYFSLYLPNLQSFITGKESFCETTSLSLSSNPIITIINRYSFY